MNRMNKLIEWLFGKQQKNTPASTPKEQTNTKTPCCDDLVHIAYRGVSDDRLYIAYDRQWQEVKFYKPHGLRVYCRNCRQRIY